MPATNDEEPPRNPKRILRAMLKVGAVGFGGGSALIPLMERELVASDRLDDREFAQDVVIASVTPGALPVKLGALGGMRLGGSRLALASAYAVAAPGAVATVGILATIRSAGPEFVRLVEFAALGVTAFILFLLAHYIRKVLAGHRPMFVGIAVTLIAYALTGGRYTTELFERLTGAELGIEVPQLSALELILLGIASIALATVVQTLRAPRRAQEASTPLRPVPGVHWALGAFGALSIGVTALAVLLATPHGGRSAIEMLLSSLTSFGGGEAYVGVADGYFVASGAVRSSDFYGQIVPIANALPGPILVKVASGVGFVIGEGSGGAIAGLLLAAVGFVVSVAASSTVAMAFLLGMHRIGRSRFVQNLTALILPVVCGLLISTIISMLLACADIGSRAEVPPLAVVAGTAALALAIGVLHRVRRVPDLIVVVVCAALALAVFTIAAS